MSELTPRIYVACLAAYNNGQLHGAWIDADQSADAIHGEIRAMLAASPIPGAEEWAIHDYEDFGGITPSAEVPENLRCYFDYGRFARDLFMSDMHSVRSGHGTVYVFERNV